MIKEFILIAYIVGGGNTEAYKYNTNFQFQRFSTMEQCEFVAEKSEEMENAWYYGKDKSDIIPAHYSMKCYELPAGAAANYTVPAGIAKPVPTVPVKRQWDWKATP